ncbi:MAG TPA: SRPBCC domain-containing protein [Gaiellaceae bacterium]|nr:SRPBCC domain-containing protein [Gaiellaceae bacterium]
MTTRITVEAVDPLERFAYRWEPGGASEGGPTTLVEFTLEEIPGGTRLTVVESGFSKFPAKSRQGNEFGWDSELGELRELLVRSHA